MSGNDITENNISGVSYDFGQYNITFNNIYDNDVYDISSAGNISVENNYFGNEIKTYGNVSNLNSLEEPVEDYTSILFINDWKKPNNITILENDELLLYVKARIYGGAKIHYSWNNDKELCSSSWFYVYQPDYNSSGKHKISINITAGRQNYSIDWNITVLNKNRLPKIDKIFPEEDITLKSNMSITLKIDVIDYDGDKIVSEWYINRIPENDNNGNELHFKPFLCGNYTIEYRAYDGTGYSSAFFNITVNDDGPFFITGVFPPLEIVIDEGQRRLFSIVTGGVKNIKYIWYIDNNKISEESYIFYEPDFQTTGIHKILCVLSYENYTRSVLWNVTVKDVNRPPVITTNSTGKYPYMFSSYDPDGDNITINYSYDKGIVYFEGGMFFGNAKYLNISVSDGFYTVWQNITMNGTEKQVPDISKNSNIIRNYSIFATSLIIITIIWYILFRRRENSL